MSQELTMLLLCMTFLTFMVEATETVRRLENPDRELRGYSYNSYNYSSYGNNDSFGLGPEGNTIYMFYTPVVCVISCIVGCYKASTRRSRVAGKDERN